MTPKLLVIARSGERHLSVHRDDVELGNALVRYVDDHWADADLPGLADDCEPEIRVATWFEATRAFLMISDASVELGADCEPGLPIGGISFSAPGLTELP